MAYNPYEAVYNITNQKGLFTDAYKKNLENPNQQYTDAMNQARNNADRYYNELRSSGNNDIAGELEKADLTNAYSILARYSPAANTSNALSSNGSNNYLSELANLSKLSAPSSQATAANEQALASSKALLDSWMGNNSQTQAQGQTLSNAVYDWANRLYNQGTTLSDYALNANPYASDIGKAIMQNYNQKGNTASINSSAENAGSNSGNIDSYSAANARRQQLAFTNAGNEAILNDHNARVANALSVLEQLGVNTQGLLGIEQANVDSARTANNNMLSGVNDSMSNAASAANQTDQTSKALMSDLSNYLSGLLGTENTNATNLETSKLANETEITKANLNSETEKALAAMQYSSASEVQEIKGKYDLLVQQAATQGVISQTEANKYIAQIEAQAKNYASDKDFEGTKYTTDAGTTNMWLQNVADNNTGATNDSNASYSNLRAAIETLMDDNSSSAESAAAEVLKEFSGSSSYSAIKQLIDAIVKEIKSVDNTTVTQNLPGAAKSGWSGGSPNTGNIFRNYQ